MRKIFFVFSIIALFVLFSSSIFAVPAAPSPTCKINAEIIKVDYIKAYFQEDNGLPCNAGGRNIPAKYLLKVKINDISPVIEEGMTCEQLYPLNSVKTLTIFENQINSGDSFKENQLIDGNIHFSGDECSSGVYLSNYKIIEEPCPQLMPPLEKEGCTYTPRYDSDNRCIVGYDEQCEACPQLTPPSPDWCKNGKIISGEIDENGCPLPPKCLLEPSKISETGKVGEAKISSPKIGTRAVTIEKSQGQLFIKSEIAIAQTNEELVLEEGKLFVKTETRNKEIKVLPEEASSKAIEITTVKEIELKEEGTELIYSVKGTKEAKILGIIPVSLEIKTKVNAETGDIISISKPWWSFLAW